VTTRRQVVVYGCGGHGKVVADLVQLNPTLNLLGFLDDGVPVGPGPLGFKVLGGAGWLDTAAARGVEVVFGIGHNPTRARICQQLADKGVRILSVVHPQAVVAGTAAIGAGTVVMANATINPDARIGKAAIINTGAVVEHDCEVGDFAHLSPNAAMGGASKLGTGSWLGLCASIIPGISVGAHTIVGAGAAVVKDLPEGCVAVGVPAKVVKKGAVSG
jgi:sugar O-acyltransferase (sialic acid O-acetyltransferase NeuD family)